MTQAVLNNWFHFPEKADSAQLSTLLKTYPFAQNLHMIKARLSDAPNDQLRAEIYHTNLAWYHSKSLKTDKNTAKVINLTHTTPISTQLFAQPETNHSAQKNLDNLVPKNNNVLHTEQTLFIELSSSTQSRPLKNTPIEVTTFDPALEVRPVEKERLKTDIAHRIQEQSEGHQTEAFFSVPLAALPKQIVSNTAKSTFVSWLKNLNPVRSTNHDQKAPQQIIVQKPDPNQSKHKTPPTKTKKKKSNKKKKSPQIDDRFISESLANLLWIQGHHKTAIKMLKKLGLKNRDKKRYFASQIKKLKKKR